MQTRALGRAVQNPKDTPSSADTVAQLHPPVSSPNEQSFISQLFFPTPQLHSICRPLALTAKDLRTRTRKDLKVDPFGTDTAIPRKHLLESTWQKWAEQERKVSATRGGVGSGFMVTYKTGTVGENAKVLGGPN